MRQTLTQIVTSQLRAEMGRQDLTRAQLARLLGTTDVWVGRRLNGVVPITLQDLDLLADRLGVSVVALVAVTSRPTPQALGDHR